MSRSPHGTFSLSYSKNTTGNFVDTRDLHLNRIVVVTGGSKQLIAELADAPCCHLQQRLLRDVGRHGTIQLLDGVRVQIRRLLHQLDQARYHVVSHVVARLHRHHMVMIIHPSIASKLCLRVYKATRGLAPSYITDMCIPVAAVSTRQSLRSAARGDLLVPRTRVKFGNRAFAVASPEAWNSLPVNIRSSDTITAFKNSLKTYLFKLSYWIM